MGENTPEQGKKPNALIIGALSGLGLALTPALVAMLDAINSGNNAAMATGGLYVTILMAPVMVALFVISTIMFISHIHKTGKLNEWNYIFCSIAAAYVCLYFFALLMG